MPDQDADGGGSHGYVHSDTDGWMGYYRDLMQGKVWEPRLSRYTGITAEAWRSGTPNHRCGGPVINDISPTSVVPGTFDLTINGSNFDAGAIDQIYLGSTLIGNGTLLSRSSTRILVREFMSGASLGTYTVNVKNSDNGLSNGVPLTLRDVITVSLAIQKASGKLIVDASSNDENASLSMTILFQDGSILERAYKRKLGGLTPVASVTIKSSSGGSLTVSIPFRP